MAKTTRTICFDTDRDADLLAWLDGQENTSGAIRAAVRSAIAPHRQEVTLEQVYQAVLDLASRSVIVRAETQSGDAPGTEQAAMALDGLGL
jgi:hypothetical protein